MLREHAKVFPQLLLTNNLNCCPKPELFNVR